MLIPYLIKVSLVLAVLTLAYRWLIQFETFSKLNRLLLWLNVAAAWTLPLISLPSWGPVEVQNEFHHSIPKVVAKLPILSEPMATIQSQPFTPSAEMALPAMNVADWISAIYFSVMLVMAGYFLFQICRLFLLIARGQNEEYPDGTFVVHVAGTSPFSFFKWIVLDPSMHSGLALNNIIAHEAEHARQWHSTDLLLAEIQKICLWFNPFAWIHQRLVQENLEYLADRAVLDNGFEKKQYQYNLLNTVMQARELPLTNSFAQSLLKKRIQMMNRKPSHYLVWSKYVALLALIYLSSAFVAPYRERIVELAPKVIRPLMKPLMDEAPSIESIKKDSTENLNKKEEVTEAAPQEEDAASAVESARIARETGPKVKGIFIRNDTLHWVITPLTTWDQINAMKAEVKKFNYDLIINKLQYDPLQSYITAISVHVKGEGSMSEGDDGDDDTSPMKGYSGFAYKGGLGMQSPLPAPLKAELEADYQVALAIKKEKEVDFFEKKVISGIGSSSGGSLSPDALNGENNRLSLEKRGFGRSEQNTLQFTDKHANSEFYINTNRSTREEVSKLPIDKIKKISYRENNQHKTYFIIHTK
ncbi:M56 family metallopeptidase [Dyadobacter fermentans]|uniref:M56 family metallopeptidase n=1 Tax=Dyadobacter fermentans TaxID=94254 RepID=UPI001CC0DF23|nr:M56 family metallopeptidase [Dyadobacter fermentans]MBZ1358076.1 peptidase M56 BlaR1 [Dyadobacter fermentans]